MNAELLHDADLDLSVVNVTAVLQSSAAEGFLSWVSSLLVPVIPCSLSLLMQRQKPFCTHDSRSDTEFTRT